MMKRVGSVAAEVGMVVFAVIVALWFEGWNEERELRERATEARAAVELEIRANLLEFERTGEALDRTAAQLSEAIDAGTMAALEGSIEFELAEVSSAAWRAAQLSEAARYLDYEWLIAVSRAYEAHEVYRRLSDQAVDAVAQMVARGPDIDRVRGLYGPIVLLTDTHRQVEQRFRELAERSEVETDGAD
ncbi:MAG: hypothetical protein AAF389_01125 [Gemmatimonadota bacterium]